MKNKEILILMYKDYEVFSFTADFKNRKFTMIEKLEHFDKAPSYIKKDTEKDSYALFKFFNLRSIPQTRTGYEDILKATGCQSGLELSFKGHGLSLSNHYWYKRKGENLKYDEINFFKNKWDDSFARAVLNQDYEALKTCDLNVPDIVTAGWGTKGWIYEEDGPKLYKLGINQDHSEEALGEVLASRLGQRLFEENEVLKYELRKVGNRYASVSPVMINLDEDLIPLSQFIPPQTHLAYRNKNQNKEMAKRFYEEIKKSDIPRLFDFFVKVACFRTICFVSDLHFDNLSVIKNANTGKIRLAPIYDLGGSFGSSRSGQSMISKPSKAVLIIVYFLFNDLDPDWDYSWYHKERLIGFEEEIRDILSKSSFYTPELIDIIIEVYHNQKNIIDKYSEKNQ